MALFCGDVTITASEAVQIPTDVTVPEGYTTVYLGQNKLYQDPGLTVELASKSHRSHRQNLRHGCYPQFVYTS